ncbi:SAGA-associated factor 29-like [Stegodyphus dumicola]|uniref:SAGA-associated factor 29-like n=1 Tax=Stegodyphus dumicola TaxID=202533 RepID=UPI0015AB7693|nr:SAGA-associated factor 29-like [Stegodyphus dumicola]
MYLTAVSQSAACQSPASERNSSCMLASEKEGGRFSYVVGTRIMQSGAAEGEIETRLREIRNALVQFEGERKKSVETISNIQKTHEQMQVELKRLDQEGGKPKNMYHTALQYTEKETELIKKALQLIEELFASEYQKYECTIKSYFMRSYHNYKYLIMLTGSRQVKSKISLMKSITLSGMSLPLWVGKSTESPPPLCGAIPAKPNYIAKVGDMVAALVTVSENEDWILAEVTGYNQMTNQYKIDDIDEEMRTEYIIGYNKVIPLPVTRANPETNPNALFPKGALVLALYPQTTCFYKAVIHKPPRKAHDPYQVLFEDSSYTNGYSPPENIHQRYVLHFMDNKINDE